MICIDNRIESLEIQKGKALSLSLLRFQEHPPPAAIRLMRTQMMETQNHIITSTAKAYLLFQRYSVQRYNTRKNSVKYEGIISEKFVSCECWDGIQKQIGRLLKISCWHAEQAFIYLQTVLSFPITSLFKQADIIMQTVGIQRLSRHVSELLNS